MAISKTEVLTNTAGLFKAFQLIPANKNLVMGEDHYKGGIEIQISPLDFGLKNYSDLQQVFIEYQAELTKLKHQAKADKKPELAKVLQTAITDYQALIDNSIYGVRMQLPANEKTGFVCVGITSTSEEILAEKYHKASLLLAEIANDEQPKFKYFFNQIEGVHDD